MILHTGANQMSGNIRKCTFCGQDAQYVYTAKFRVGGTSGGMKLLLGEWAELGETMIPMYVFVCPNCGKIELYATDELKQHAIHAANAVEQ
jgi:hypothetical protein